MTVAVEQTAARDAVDELMALTHVIKALASKASDDTWMSLDLSMAQLKAFMIVVHTGGLPSRALAERMRVGPSAVTPVVDRLVAQKLVRREDDPHDRRVAWIRPTPKAAALHESLLESNRRVLERVIAAVPAKKARAVHEALSLLAQSARDLLQNTEDAR